MWSTAKSSLVALTVCLAGLAWSQRTYCNPINVDYGYCPIPNFVQQGKHRATADPVIVTFKGDYYLFSTNQWGYWWSHDMSHWTFVAHKFLRPDIATLDGNPIYDELCAPAVWVMGDQLMVIGSTYQKNWQIMASGDPKNNEWHEAIHEFPVGAWDPAFFLDDDGRLYLYHGSSNAFPIYAWEIDPKTLLPISERKDLFGVGTHGWERFGEANDNTFLKPFIEGAWMTKHGGKYYLQYAAPGTEFSGYGDGVYVADHPLGPFTYQASNPFSLKPGGFARGAGHGATYQDFNGDWWHVSTIGICVKNNFERRIGIWPANFDSDGVLSCDQAYGDYPTYLPDPRQKGFAGWMLLNYNRSVQVSSTLGGFAPNYAVDESIKTYWSAKTGNKGEWIETELNEPSTVRAVQINYADQDADVMGKAPGLYHQYQLFASLDGRRWSLIVDKAMNKTDVPHDYVELEKPVEAKYLKLVNIHMPTGKFAISGIRAFGLGHGQPPKPVQGFVALRGTGKDNMGIRENAWLKWAPSDDADGYVVRVGVAPDKLTNSVMVYGANEYYWRYMDADKTYYFQIEAFNQNGISARSEVMKAE
ncbi:MAG: family 43 glycosylhydrolase [Armatimonadetes bacterium]|nr:family 43 glycosylhydrolase [Armatimonadota bacterium]